MKTLWFDSILLRALRPLLACALWLAGAMALVHGAEEKAESPWRALPLIVEGKVSDAWCHVRYGGFIVEDRALRTECSPKGLGLLVYKPETFGNCQIRGVVGNLRQAAGRMEDHDRHAGRPSHLGGPRRPAHHRL